MLLLSPLWTLLTYLGPFLFVLSLVVFFHELGHFLVGRACGVKVDAFSIGFGPELCAFVDHKGTRWRLAAFPLGGYVKFHGDANGASAADHDAIANMQPSERAETLTAQPVWKRALIVAAGPAANFVLAIAIFSGINYLDGRAVLTPIVSSVIPGQAAQAAGFKAGDLVLSIDGKPVEGWSDMQDKVQDSAGIPLTVVVRRGDGDVTLVATPVVHTINTIFGKSRVALLGLNGSSSPADVHVKYYSFPTCVQMAANETWFAARSTVDFVGQLFTGKQSVDQISGPVGIAKISGEVARFGFAALLNLAAILSISIGLVNLAPIPLLDGGHLLYFAVETLLGRPMSERAQEFGFRVGLGLVLALMIFVTFNDIMHFTRS
jgi:regulator of sigma E protease